MDWVQKSVSVDRIKVDTDQNGSGVDQTSVDMDKDSVGSDLNSMGLYVKILQFPDIFFPQISPG